RQIRERECVWFLGMISFFFLLMLLPYPPKKYLFVCLSVWFFFFPFLRVSENTAEQTGNLGKGMKMFYTWLVFERCVDKLTVFVWRFATFAQKKILRLKFPD